MTFDELNQRDGPTPASCSRVLLVDDHAPGRKSLARLLDALGFEVTAVGDATSAIKTLQSAARFEFVLTDLRLPDHDGREVVNAARQLDPKPRIALITGWDIDSEEQIELEIDWIFLKPLDIQDIVSKLREAPPT